MLNYIIFDRAIVTSHTVTLTDTIYPQKILASLASYLKNMNLVFTQPCLSLYLG